MSVTSFDDLLPHVGHHLVCVSDTQSVTVECQTCKIVLVDFEEPKKTRADVLKTIREWITAYSRLRAYAKYPNLKKPIATLTPEEEANLAHNRRRFIEEDR